MTNLPPLNHQTLWQILDETLPDATVNQLVWTCLGYRWDGVAWDSQGVDPAWREPYPTPPDFIDSRPATVQLTRSIPPQYKQLLKEELGFTGYPIKDLTPRRTRRATAVSWLLSYGKGHTVLRSE